MKKIAKLPLTLFAALMTIIALAFSGSACLWGWYQPTEPKALRNR